MTKVQWAWPPALVMGCEAKLLAVVDDDADVPVALSRLASSAASPPIV